MGKIKEMDVAGISACILAQKGNRSLRQLCADSGLPASDNALLSKLLRGEPVSVATLRRVGRALHCLEQPRKMHRVVMKEDEFQAWQSMNRIDRRRALGLR